MTALATPAVTLRARVAPRMLAWTLIGQITQGRLLALRVRGHAELRSSSCRVLARSRRDRDDAEPACARPGRSTVTTTPPP
jgi:hypothetical protein